MPPLPVAEEGGAIYPQPRTWRAVAKQAREVHCGKVFSFFNVPLPVAEKDGAIYPQPRRWRTMLTREKRVTFKACLVKQARQWHCGKALIPPVPHELSRLVDDAGLVLDLHA